MLHRRSLVAVTALVIVATSIVVLSAPPQAEGATFINWPAYQYQNVHGSHNAAATAITTQNAANVAQAWKWVPEPPTMPGQPGAGLQASPTVHNGRIYIGSKTGVFYVLDEATGTVIWKRFVGFQTGRTCSAQGFASTATVTTDPTTGILTVYVAAFTGQVFAFEASDGDVIWSAQVVTPSENENDYALWSSPAVANGHVYVGTSSACNRPSVRSGVVSLSQADGAIQGQYFTNDDYVGGSVWSSVAVDPNDGSVFVTTGNPESIQQVDDAYSIVRLDGETLLKTAIWTLPTAEQTFDADFGASPTLFNANIGGVNTNLVAACSKNGRLYVLNRDNLAAGPIWWRQMGVWGSNPNACIGGASWDGTRLYQGSNATTIGGTSYPGSIRAFDPATGTPLWEVGLPHNVINTPTVNGSGVLAVGTFNFESPTTNAAYLINAATGQILRTWTTGLNGGVFAQMVFADDYVFIPSISNGLRAFKPPAAPPNQPPTASFTHPCNGLTCSFDGSASSDSDGTVVGWAWNFGDNTTGTGVSAQHTYANAGTYQVSLTVTDDDDAIGSTSSMVTAGQPAGIAFRGSATANGNRSTFTVTVPSGVSAGDGLLLIASVNNTAPTVTPPAGWQEILQQLPGGMRTIVWQRVATSGDAGTSVQVTLSATAKADVQLLAYSGTAPSGPLVTFASAGDSTSTANHTTPVVNVTTSGSWVVSYWADKSGTTTAWTAPPGQTVRPHSSYTSPAAYITSLITDSGSPVPTGSYGGLTASVNAPSSKATMVSLVLAPDSPNAPPIASFTPSCNGLTCSFDGSASSDPDGTVLGWAWNFGDNTTGSGPTTQHTYASAGTYQVSLTVTDDDDAQGSTSSMVNVGQPPAIAFRGSSTANGNRTTFIVTVPANVSAGDGLLLFASVNNITPTVTPPAGWQQVTEQLAGMRTVVWQRVATGTDAGTSVQVTLSVAAKADVQLLAYSGTAASGPVAAFASAGDNTSTANHTTPVVNVAGSGSWVVSYWADKSSSTTSWTAPAGQTVRDHPSYTTPAAYVTSLITDSGSPVPTGSYGGLTASVNAPSSKATMMSLVLAPA